jgi:hypothetical protein
VYVCMYVCMCVHEVCTLTHTLSGMRMKLEVLSVNDSSSSSTPTTQAVVSGYFSEKTKVRSIALFWRVD